MWYLTPPPDPGPDPIHQNFLRENSVKLSILARRANNEIHVSFLPRVLHLFIPDVDFMW